jgi:hypothetical protein
MFLFAGNVSNRTEYYLNIYGENTLHFLYEDQYVNDSLLFLPTCCTNSLF